LNWGRIFISITKIFEQEHIDIVMEVGVFPFRSHITMEHMYLNQITIR
jgi:pyrrolidone-carboxylate peptidase